MIDEFPPEPAAAWLAARLHEARRDLDHRWHRSFPRTPGISDLIAAIAHNLRQPSELDLTTDTLILKKATELGVLRFAQGSTVPRLLREYEALADLVEEFLLDQVAHAETPLAADQVARAMRRVTQSVRVLQQQTVASFVQKYTETIARQSDQLLKLGRLVGQELRQPLSVLQLMAALIPVREGDLELTRLLDVFDRNVRRLANVAGRLERLSHDELDATVVPGDETTDLGVVVADVVEKLQEMAHARGVRVDVTGPLPTLRVDAARTEMMFVSLIANAIKYSDPAKTQRVVEVSSSAETGPPTVIVRDNGIGIPRRRVQHFFRELTRSHAHRDRDLRGDGLGLGLSIVRSTMDGCGGTVLLQSSEGVGTTVTLSWPLRTMPVAR